MSKTLKTMWVSLATGAFTFIGVAQALASKIIGNG
jgi:hypothetical protein